MSTQTNKPIIVYVLSNRYSNQGNATWLISIKQLKPLKGRYHGRLQDVSYAILPGHYIVVSWHYWNKDNPTTTVTIDIEKIYEKDNGNVTFESVSKALKFRYDTEKDFENLPEDLKWIKPLLEAIEKSAPGYHSPSTTISFEGSEVIRQLVNYLRNLNENKEFILSYQE